MQLEWRTTDKNTILDECEFCHLERPVKKMKIPGIEEYLSDEDFEDEYTDLTELYCLSCYKQAETGAQDW